MGFVSKVNQPEPPRENQQESDRLENELLLEPISDGDAPMPDSPPPTPDEFEPESQGEANQQSTPVQNGRYWIR